MTRYTKIIAIIFFHSLLINDTAICQSCSGSNKTFVGYLLGGSDSNSNISTTEVSQGPSAPRTEMVEINVSFSMMNIKEQPTTPLGIKVAMYQQVKNIERMYIGASFSFHEYGKQILDTLLGAYDYIFTSTDLLSFNGHIKYRVVNSKLFHVNLGVFGGAMLATTSSVAYDDNPNCERRQQSKNLHSFNKVTPNSGLSLGIQIPFKNYFDKISFEFAYYTAQMIETINLKKMVIRPNDIQYISRTDNWRKLNIQIGLSFYL